MNLVEVVLKAMEKFWSTSSQDTPMRWPLTQDAASGANRAALTRGDLTSCYDQQQLLSAFFHHCCNIGANTIPGTPPVIIPDSIVSLLAVAATSLS